MYGDLVYAAPGLKKADIPKYFKDATFGVKQDGVPGYINEVWFNAETEGVYRGQCAELCGMDHGFMPIVVRVTSRDEYNTWLASQRTQTSSLAQAQ